MKFYAVKCGRKPGIYTDWPSCKLQTIGFPNAIFKSFDNIKDAEDFMSIDISNEQTNDTLVIEYPAAFIDGSVNPNNKTYGYGCVIYRHDDSTPIEISGFDSLPDLQENRNVTGELLGCMNAINTGIELGFIMIHIYYDYAGIEMWANGIWDLNDELSKNYKRFIDEKRKDIIIIFHKVKAHSGIYGNERADALAKMSVGIN